MNAIGLRIAGSDLQQVVGKLGRAASRSYLGEVPSRLGLDSAKHIGSSATLVFIVPSGGSSRLHGDDGAEIPMQDDRLLIDTYHRLVFPERSLIQAQDLLHPGDVLLV
jgi:hypothetical protein